MGEAIALIPAEAWGFGGVFLGALLQYLSSRRTAKTDAVGLRDAAILEHMSRQDARIKALEAVEDEHRAFERAVHRLSLEGRTTVYLLDRAARKQSMKPPQQQVRLPDVSGLVVALDAVDKLSGGGRGSAREPPVTPV